MYDINIHKSQYIFGMHQICLSILIISFFGTFNPAAFLWHSVIFVISFMGISRPVADFTSLGSLHILMFIFASSVPHLPVVVLLSPGELSRTETFRRIHAIWVPTLSSIVVVLGVERIPCADFSSENLLFLLLLLLLRISLQRSCVFRIVAECSVFFGDWKQRWVFRGRWTYVEQPSAANRLYISVISYQRFFVWIQQGSESF